MRWRSGGLTLRYGGSNINRRVERFAAPAPAVPQFVEMKGALLRTLIAIPIYNELKYIQPVISRIKGYHSEILVVDDGSTDGSGDLLQARDDIHLIRHPTNQGYGRSIIDAFDFASNADYDWVITMDCDEQHEPERIPDFMREIESDRWDLISGSRYMAEFTGNDAPPTDRRQINQTLTALLNELFDLNLTDSFCGFKAHRVAAMRRLELTEPGYAFPMQLWPQVVWARLRMTEIPVRLIYNDPNRTFGGILDDAACRLKHYLDVLREETARLGQVEASQAVAERVAAVPCKSIS